MVDFIYDLIQSLKWNHSSVWFLSSLSIVCYWNLFWRSDYEKGYFGRGEKISFLMVYRFADDLIRCVHNEDASPLRSYSDSSSLSSTCMPTRVFITILLFRSFKNTQDNEPSSNTDEVIKIIVASNFITEAARRPAVLIIYLWWQESFFVHVITIVRNAQTTVASSFRLHFRCVCFFGPMATASQL